MLWLPCIIKSSNDALRAVYSRTKTTLGLSISIPVMFAWIIYKTYVTWAPVIFPLFVIILLTVSPENKCHP